jgi:tetratricopeptide (TPR) repeat protein
VFNGNLTLKNLTPLLAFALSFAMPAGGSCSELPSGGQLLIASSCSNAKADRLCDKARSLLTSKRYQEALPLLQEAAEYDSQCAEIQFYLGSAYYHTKAMEQAIEAYQKVLRFQPQTPEAVFNIGSCYEHLHQYDQAIAWYERYVREYATAADAADVRHTVEEIKKHMEVHRLFKESHDLLEAKRALDARFLLEKAEALEPNSPEIHYNLGMAYHNSGNLPKAIEEFQRALQLKPDMTDALLNIGSSYQALGKKDEAISWFHRYLNASPKAEDYKAITDMIASLQKDGGQQVADDPHGPDFWASITKQGLPRRWPPEKLPIKIFVDSGSLVSGMHESFRQILIDSLEAWMKAAQGRLSYQQVARPDQADLVCDWTSNPGEVTGKGTESEQGVAHIFGRDSGQGSVEISRATVRILTIDKEKSEELPVSDDMMKKTCLHEIGHALGLMGHSPNSHDVMFFSESPTVWPVLSKRDKATLLRLYESYPATFGPTPLAWPSR